ncbi:hypothetical protein GRF29_1g952751 [Pseudopithomyces chartarum]|uniref:Uncharacterized protein n=1 Tax=Pseudopithomyces chartarum TaxID=1892770 RepID=A0AAN6M5H8_9PLEO|nr:hypothetical protein GRF29_1g952751 [Pseudopithomyces chartarum]
MDPKAETQFHARPMQRNSGRGVHLDRAMARYVLSLCMHMQRCEANEGGREGIT